MNGRKVEDVVMWPEDNPRPIAEVERELLERAPALLQALPAPAKTPPPKKTRRKK